jgi:hypothetical protein
MKHVVASLTIGACLLLSSAGDVFAENPHPGGAVMGSGGQLGTLGQGMSQHSGVASCGGAQASPSGQFMNPNTNSPFPTGIPGTMPSPNYAGTSGTQTNPHANSQYDNACLHQPP